MEVTGYFSLRSDYLVASGYGVRVLLAYVAGI